MDIEAPIEFADAYVNLARMLEDLDVGTVHPVLRANPSKSGAPKDSAFIWEGRANVALGMVAVLAAGKRREAAAKCVANDLGPALDRVRRANSRQGEPWRAVANWYDAFGRFEERCLGLGRGCDRDGDGRALRSAVAAFPVARSPASP